MFLNILKAAGAATIVSAFTLSMAMAQVNAGGGATGSAGAALGAAMGSDGSSATGSATGSASGSASGGLNAGAGNTNLGASGSTGANAGMGTSAGMSVSPGSPFGNIPVGPTTASNQTNLTAFNSGLSPAQQGELRARCAVIMTNSAMYSADATAFCQAYGRLQ